jgi:DNA-binding MarR family transcriptional regulator
MVSLRYQMPMICPPVLSDEIAELLVHVGRAARGEDQASPLTAVQWTCLRFFARANSVSRTPSAFARFQATTRGTASQTIKGLEARGLVSRTRCADDGRSIRVEITAQGRAMLEGDPLGGMLSALDRLEPAECAAFLSTLVRLSGTLAAQKGVQSFGTCGACIHYAQARGGGYCACLAAHLSPEDLGKLCVNFGSGGDEPPAATDNFNRKGEQQ